MKHQIKTKILGVVGLLALGAAILPASSAMAAESTSWGPQDRKTFTWDSPADYPVFNSMTNNPDLGDERYFVRLREANTDDDYSTSIVIEAGKTYEVYIYYHNNASATYNSTAYGSKGLAQNVTVASSMPATLKANEPGSVTGSISTISENADPKKVWATAYMTAKEAVTLNYVANSATLHNNGIAKDGLALDSNYLFSDDGVQINYYDYVAYPSLAGIIPGCNEFAGYVTYLVQANDTGSTIDKKVSAAGENDYKDEIVVAPGSVLDFKIDYTNSGTTPVDNVQFHDVMPDGLSYVAGTTFAKTPANTTGAFVSDNLFGSGLNLGYFYAKQTAEITYKVEVADDEKIFPCGDTVVYNNSSVAAGDTTEYDKVKVTVRRNCGSDTPVTPSTLPNSGAGSYVAILMCTTWLGFGVAYLVRSRMELKKQAAEL